ncbi:protein of unknown function [Burkholderia multivorans]
MSRAERKWHVASAPPLHAELLSGAVFVRNLVTNRHCAGGEFGREAAERHLRRRARARGRNSTCLDAASQTDAAEPQAPPAWSD